MSVVVGIEDGSAVISLDEEMSRLTFLKDKGLELLSLYRRIEDKDVRTAVMTLLKRLVAAF